MSTNTKGVGVFEQALKIGKEGTESLGKSNVSKEFLLHIAQWLFVGLIIAGIGALLYYFALPKAEQSILDRIQNRQDVLNKWRNSYTATSVPTPESKPKEGFATQAQVKQTVGMEASQSLYTSLMLSMDPTERYLINLCPLTASIGGFLGPLDQGLFEPNYFVRTCLKSGIRSFVLPISTYLDDNKVPPNWPYSTKPAIVYRQGNGQITSLNGMSVKDFCKALVVNRNENTVQSSEPILLYLHADEKYLPDPSKEEKDYVKFMSELATELEPLEGQLFKTYKNMGSMMNAKREREILLEIPLEELKNKILIFTNFDFRKFENKAYTNIEKKLGNYINFYYTPVVSENVGLGKGSGGRSMRLEDVSGSKVDWKNQARTLWHTSILSSPSLIPDVAVVDNAIRTGIQAIPCPWIFQDVDPKAFQVWQLWRGYAFRLKEPSARYAKPVPVQPQVPSAKLNARVAPTLQPGQTKIK